MTCLQAHRPFWDSKYKRCISQSDVYNQEICDMVTEWEEKYKEANGGVTGPRWIEDGEVGRRRDMMGSWMI